MPLPPVPPLPAFCSVEALRVWINSLAECDLPEESCRSCLNTARAVRALLEAKCREVIEEYEEPVVGGEWTTETVAHYAKLKERAMTDAINSCLGAP